MFDTLTLFLEYAFPFCLQMPSLQNENNFWHLQSWNGRRHAQKLEWNVLRLHEVTIKIKVKVVRYVLRPNAEDSFKY